MYRIYHLCKSTVCEQHHCCRVNDVQALGPNSFYFTNYQYFSSPPLVMIERFMRLAITDIVYFDGKDYVVVADGMASLNGIAMSADGR